MFRGENVAAILPGKLLARIKRHFKRRIVRLHQNIGRNHSFSELGMFVAQSRVLMSTHVVPGPTVESSLLYVRDVVGHEVVAQAITLIDRPPKLTSLGIDGNSDRVAYS